MKFAVCVIAASYLLLTQCPMAAYAAAAGLSPAQREPLHMKAYLSEDQIALLLAIRSLHTKEFKEILASTTFTSDQIDWAAHEVINSLRAQREKLFNAYATKQADGALHIKSNSTDDKRYTRKLRATIKKAQNMLDALAAYGAQ